MWGCAGSVDTVVGTRTEGRVRSSNQDGGKVRSYIRTRISFAMLKSILVSIHGVRDKRGRKEGGILYASDVAFGLIPEEESYECR